MIGQGSVEGLKTLRTGFIFSLASLVLFVFLRLEACMLGANVAANIFFVYVFPFLLLFVWAYGAFKRSRGWNLEGQKKAADVLSLSWKVNLLFILPLPLFLSWLTLGTVLFSPFLPLLTAAVTTVAWGYSTLCEAKGLRKLEEENKVSFRLPRFCSLAGVLVYACSILIYTYVSFVYVGYDPFPIFVFPTYGYFSILTSSMLLASPILVISCIAAIIRLKKTD